MNKKYKLLLSAVSLGIVSVTVANPSFAAANFNITPKKCTPLPTQIFLGGTVSAFYTITNQTNTARNDYVVQGLPRTVTQNTSKGNCSNPVNLAAHASCTLQLDITGEVHSGFALCRGSSCTTTTVPLNVKKAKFIPMVAAGYYNVIANYYYAKGPSAPLLASSTSNGITWSYRITSTTPTLPEDYAGIALFSSASCSGGNCIAAGSYTAPPLSLLSEKFPLLAQSGDGGVSWAYRITSGMPTFPTDLINGTFASASCSGINCIAAGQYFNGANTIPLLANSTDGGVIWTYSIDSSTPTSPADATDGQFLSASCSGLNCIAAGMYAADLPSPVKTNASFPLLANSTDGGITWTYSIDSATPTLPEDAVDGQFSSASCSGLHCVAAGQYDTVDSTFPLLANSTDGGVTWTYSIDSTSPTLPTGATAGQFNSVSCSRLNCIAAGTYTVTPPGSLDKNTSEFPLLASSTDGGVTWTYRIDATTPALPADYNDSSQFSSASCSRLHCVAAGQYNTLDSTVPLLANSKDGGVTWTYRITATTPALPGDFAGNALFSSASCSELDCIAAGQYEATPSSAMKRAITSPLLANSTDGGVTWTYRIDATTPTLPEDFNGNGLFNSTSISTASLLLPNLKLK